MTKRHTLTGWLSRMMTVFRSHHDKDLADVWLGESARTNCMSIEAGNAELRACFRNLCDVPVVLCWVDHRGNPHHFYRLEPCEFRGHVCKDDHVETTRVGHAFIIAKGNDVEKIQKRKSLDGATIVAGYRGKEEGLQLVEIRPGREPMMCCGTPRLRGSAKAAQSLDSCEFHLFVRPGVVDPTPLDTTTKTYISTTLGGWPVQLDSKINPDDDRLRHLSQDLEALSRCLPPHASEFLKKSTPLWINDIFRYGPIAYPIKGTNCCFHPDVNWLKEMGCHEEKCECVELYNLDAYNRSRNCWMTGGLMLHEYSHAYHFKYLKNGYENRAIKECYQAAMKQKLYDCVGVHQSDGPSTAKAYACENQMEYFAELSAAFLGGLDSVEEFNKWYPFNRKQIKSHDPKAFDMLMKIWQVKDE